MNDAGVLALFISVLAFFICTPTIAFCFCSNKTKRQYRILSSTNYSENASIA